MADLDQVQAAASRFVTSEEIEVEKAKKDEEWRAAYARIGQEPPSEVRDDGVVHDTRTLYEKLESAKNAKQEEWDEKMKLGNQYRGLHDEELRFLNDTESKKRSEERRIAKAESDEVKAFHQALAAKQAAAPPEFSPPADTAPPPVAKKPVVGKPVRKDVKSLLKGVVVKKKAKPAVKPAEKRALTPENAKEAETEGDSKKRKTDD